MSAEGRSGVERHYVGVVLISSFCYVGDMEWRRGQNESLILILNKESTEGTPFVRSLN